MKHGFERGSYRFERVRDAHLPMLRGWLAEPHVVEWWGAPDHELALIRESLDFDWLTPYVVSHAGQPFGYTQFYDIFAEDYQPFPDQPRGTHALDSFIGPAGFIARGHGSAFLRAISDEAFARGIPRIIVDPDPDNARAIAAYAEAGYARLGERDTPEGRVLLMARDAESPGQT